MTDPRISFKRVNSKLAEWDETVLHSQKGVKFGMQGNFGLKFLKKTGQCVRQIVSGFENGIFFPSPSLSFAQLLKVAGGFYDTLVGFATAHRETPTTKHEVLQFSQFPTSSARKKGLQTLLLIK